MHYLHWQRQFREVINCRELLTCNASRQARQEYVQINSLTARTDVFIDITLHLERGRFADFATIISSSNNVVIHDSNVVVKLSWSLNLEATMLSKRTRSPSLKLTFSGRSRQKTNSICPVWSARKTVRFFLLSGNMSTTCGSSTKTAFAFRFRNL